MKKNAYLVLSVILILAVSWSGCARPAEEPAEGAGDQISVAADEEAIRALVEDFDRVVNARDLDGLMAQFVDEPTTLPPGGPPARGAPAFRQVWGDFLAQGDVEVDNVAQEVWISEDLAVGWGTFTSAVQPDEGEPVEDVGKWMAVWRRQADGSWKAAVNIWNSDSQPIP